jgi:hypothetical protein
MYWKIVWAVVPSISTTTHMTYGADDFRVVGACFRGTIVHITFHEELNKDRCMKMENNLHINDMCVNISVYVCMSATISVTG